MSEKPKFGVIVNMAEHVAKRIAQEPVQDAAAENATYVLGAVLQAKDMAEKGEIDGIAISIIQRDGSANNFYVKGSNRWALLGAVHRTASRIEDDVDRA